MKFITVVDVPKIDEIISKGMLENNYAFDMEEGARSVLVEKLNDLSVEVDSVINGYCLDGSSGDLTNLWSKFIRSFPVKSGDVIIQFSVDEAECVFCDFNDFMDYNYSGDFDFIEDIISYRFDSEKIAFTQQLDLLNFEKAFIVSDEWSKNNLINSSIGSDGNSGLLTNVQDLKVLGRSSVWR